MLVWESIPASPRLQWISTLMLEEDIQAGESKLLCDLMSAPSLSEPYLLTWAIPLVSPVGGEFQAEQLPMPESTGHVQSLLSVPVTRACCITDCGRQRLDTSCCVSLCFLGAKQKSEQSFLESSGTQETDTRTHPGLWSHCSVQLEVARFTSWPLVSLGTHLTGCGWRGPACHHQYGCMRHEQGGRWWNLLQVTVVSDTVELVRAASSAYVKGGIADLGGPGLPAAALAIRDFGTSVL